VAPAKLTLSLLVVARRPDGFHDLDAEMVSIDLADQLDIDPAGDGLDVVGDGVTDLPAAGPGNLVSRALAAVGRRAQVRLLKRIPAGGGLGGGSSDAAAVLRWAGCFDVAVAASLGADVPFCLHGGRARVGGLGERVVPLEDQPRAFVLLVPPFGVETAAVYRAWDGLADGDRHAPGGAGGENDLTTAALVVEPALARWRDTLGELTGRPPRLAGSGATWFVEGSADELGLDVTRPVAVAGRVGRVIPVRTVPGAPGAGGNG
jgi:4-diphosphocytidyl-2-C-methyl-D-erythritol kinase